MDEVINVEKKDQVSLYLKQRTVIKYLKEKVEDVDELETLEAKVLGAKDKSLKAFYDRLDNNKDISVEELLAPVMKINR